MAVTCPYACHGLLACSMHVLFKFCMSLTTCLPHVYVDISAFILGMRLLHVMQVILSFYTHMYTQCVYLVSVCVWCVNQRHWHMQVCFHGSVALSGAPANLYTMMSILLSCAPMCGACVWSCMHVYAKHVSITAMWRSAPQLLFMRHLCYVHTHAYVYVLTLTVLLPPLSLWETRCVCFLRASKTQ